MASLTNAKDSDRLNLFKEIAGTGAYEERRNESIKLMEETSRGSGSVFSTQIWS